MNLLNKKNILYLSITLFFVGAFLRFYQINFESYWWDEMLGFWVADPNITTNETIYRQRNHDLTSVIFHFIIKNFYKIFGYNPELGRYIPLFFGILSIPFLGILSKQVKNNNSYLISILLISINIYLISYSQETRHYSLVFLVSIINLIIYYNIVFSINFGIKKIFIFFLFIFFSILSLSISPFILIIFFSQIAYLIYEVFFLKKKNYLIILSTPIIIIFYVILNYDFLFTDLAKQNNHFIANIEWNFIYNLFFPRFFGSSIMGFIYLFLLLFLLIYNRQKIFLKSSKYPPLIFILLLSYIVPFIYGILFAPILFDRYIIFVLIPIILLLSTLIYEVKNNHLKNIIILILLIPSLINIFLEVALRDETKPEFSQLLKYFETSEVKNITILTDKEIISQKTLDIVENYINSRNITKKNNFKILNFHNLPENINSIWVICYERFTGPVCKIPKNKTTNFQLLDSIKFYLLEAKLIKVKKL
tara:strand:+ start:685 stop:2118 length:1434 start_codon:yes stop_codon:yes gene_type:complete